MNYFIAAVLGGIVTELAILVFKIDALYKLMSSANQDSYQKAVETQKAPKEFLPPAITSRGRKLVDQNQLVDLADIDPEIGIAALEEMGNL